MLVMFYCLLVFDLGVFMYIFSCGDRMFSEKVEIGVVDYFLNMVCSEGE